MQRRDFIVGLGGAAAVAALWALAARAEHSRVQALELHILRSQAVGAAFEISAFIREIESQLGWIAQLPWPAGIIDRQALNGLRLLPAIRRLSLIDSAGRLHARDEADEIMPPYPDDIGTDYSEDPRFSVAMAKKVYYGPVYFRRDTEPYMTLAVAGTRPDPLVSIAEVNLKLVFSVVSQIKVGEHGHAYLVDGRGRLIAHPDISLVLRNTDMSKLAQVQAARRLAEGTSGSGGQTEEQVQVAQDIQGRQVLAAYAPVTPLGWLVFTELPVREA